MKNCASSLGVIAKAINATLCGNADAKFNGISTDTRQIKEGMLFVALSGEIFDGDTFIEQAISKGAVAVIATNIPDGIPGLKVANTLIAYQSLARWYRNSLDAKIVAITGSCGKTSVKELLDLVFSSQALSFKNYANNNNQIGVAKTILDARSDVQYGVVEAGTNHPGEIEPLAKIINADISIITNVGIGHTEYFPSINDLIVEKMSLCEVMGSKGVSLIPADIEFSDKLLSVPKNKVLTYGLDSKNDYYPEDLIFDNFGVGQFKFKGVAIKTNLCGKHSVRNILATLAVSDILGIDISDTAKSLQGYSGYEKRFLIEKVADRIIIDDTYNANLISTIGAIESLKSIEVSGKRIAVLGSMLELGGDAPLAHKTVLEKATDLVDIVYTFGNEYAEVENDFVNKNITNFTTQEKLTESLIKNSFKNDAILFKGSRGMKIENILLPFKKALGANL